ncbi:unnamed protein product [Brassica oleracea]
MYQGAGGEAGGSAGMDDDEAPPSTGGAGPKIEECVHWVASEFLLENDLVTLRLILA